MSKVFSHISNANIPKKDAQLTNMSSFISSQFTVAADFLFGLTSQVSEQVLVIDTFEISKEVYDGAIFYLFNRAADSHRDIGVSLEGLKDKKKSEVQ